MKAQAMERSRAVRRDRVRSRRRQLLLTGAGVLAAVAVFIAVVVAGEVSGARSSARSALKGVRAVATPPMLPVSTTGTATPVEVPNVTGRTFTEADLVLTCAGFVVASNGASLTADGKPTTVCSQSPPPGTKLGQGEQISIVLATPDPARKRALVVVLDPGHQAKADLAPEPIAPGSSETKEKATAGATGVVTKQQECDVALAIALLMKSRLEAAGVQVLITRMTSDVDLSNVQRAQLANRAAADLLVRVHADAGSSAELHGVSVLVPAASGASAPIATASKRAAVLVDRALVKATSAEDCGITERSDFAGFNWSKVPAILVEAGYLSNTADDRLLATPGYQGKVADGAVAGIMNYFGR
jgi:N-acetylmuramoyl-L-alanine amidase